MAHERQIPDIIGQHISVPEAQRVSARVRLRQWTRADFEAFAALNADPQVMRHFPALLAREQSDAHAARIRSLIEERGWGFWAADSLEDPSGAQFMGFVGLHVPTVDLPFQPCVEIGWRLARRFWGRGLATEAARMAMRVGFETLGLPELVSFTALDNLRSRAVMQRLGMHTRVEDRFEHPAVPEGHPLSAHCLYRLTREEWLERQPGTA